MANIDIFRVYIYVLVGYAIKLEKNNRCPQKKKFPRSAFVQLSCRYILLLLSVSLVTSDDFTLLRIDSYQLALLI
jgi:hypothetical protein